MEFDTNKFHRQYFPWMFNGKIEEASDESLLEMYESMVAWNNYDPSNHEKEALAGAALDKDDVRKEILRRMQK